MKTYIEDLFHKEMTRKEFLQYIGSALLIMFGISNLLKMLQSQPKSTTSNMGYGASVYGGTKKSLL